MAEPQKRQTREWISVLSRVAALLGDLLSLAWGGSELRGRVGLSDYALALTLWEPL